jgi:hypothetical protein
MEKTVLRLSSLAAVLLALGLPGAASAQMAAFTADCPLGNTVVSDGAGTVRVNGAAARVETFNPNYIEARIDGFTFSISRDPGMNNWSVVYTGPNRANGVCTTTASAEGPDADDGGGAMAGSGMESGAGAAFWRVNVHSTLNVHGAPSTASPTFYRLHRNTVVRNLGCERSEGRMWCQVPIAPGDGASIGWVAAEYLVPAAGPAPEVDHGSAPEPTTQTVRVRFASGASGAQESGTLTPGSSVRYVLGAANRQTLEVHFLQTDPDVEYQIFLPNGRFLLDRISNALPYQGELFMGGDHVVEVINRGHRTVPYAVYMGIY